ncbi:hypothetical protein C9994_06370 [Marivirga lumbricoides]|uniref:Methyltransferase FkbM domain-containing protein n=1 Tax=Marivirga lumbricoides TaxID=1046115 RepID=A0A2T4DS83_9BACT|nr:hypothetical protein C9994_06370 [Marivirga lumbricoides]
MRKLINLINRKVASFLGTSKINLIEEKVTRIEELFQNIHITEYLNKNLFHNKKYTDSKRITHYHNSVFTQNGEDGIIEEIFERVGVKNKTFIEFGAHGIKNNSTYLLLKGWSGFWIIGSEKGFSFINKKFKVYIETSSLILAKKWITKYNIESIFKELSVPKEVDFLSIDIDGNDYWVWENIINYNPRVVSIEYNATFPPNISLAMKYNEDHKWQQDSYFGASLLALQKLGEKKGYKLIGCDFAGCNAFFVRKDLSLELFESPFTAENHYEPARYFIRRNPGHPIGIGEYNML